MTETTPAHADPLYQAYPPMFRNNPLGFVLAVLLIAAFGLGILILLYWFVVSRTHKLTITRNYVLYEEGLLSKRRVETRIEDIRTVAVNQTFWQRIFGTGDLDVYTAGDEPEIALKGFPDPFEIRELTRER